MRDREAQAADGRVRAGISRFKRNWCGQLVLYEFIFILFFLFCSQCSLIPRCFSLAFCLFLLSRSTAAAAAVLFVAEHLFTFEWIRYVNREWGTTAAFALCGMFSIHKHLFLHYFSSKNVLLFPYFFLFHFAFFGVQRIGIFALCPLRCHNRL